MTIGIVLLIAVLACLAVIGGLALIVRNALGMTPATDARAERPEGSTLASYPHEYQREAA